MPRKSREEAKMELSETGRAIRAIMERKGMTTSELAAAMGKSPRLLCDRISQRTISVERLDEIVRVMGYKISIVPRATRGEDFHDIK